MDDLDYCALEELLAAAADWVARQDPAPGFVDLVAEEVERVREVLGRDR
jgi:hypothetical protein